MADVEQLGRISVVIATYNRSAMVCDAVKSAWNQTVKPYEIVVSDDASNDDTLNSLKELAKEIPILKIIKNASNSGGVPNWNRAVNEAVGDIIAWCSDDDYFNESHLENAINFLNEHAEIDMVFADFINESVFDDGTVLRDKSKFKSNKNIIVDKTNFIGYITENYNWPFHPSSLVFRRTLWGVVGEFNPAYALADTEWFSRCALSGKLAYLPYYAVINRRHYGGSGNWSCRVGSVQMQKELRSSIDNFYHEVFQDNKIRKDYKRWKKTYFILLARIAVSRCRSGHHDVAIDVANEMKESFSIINIVPGKLFFYFAWILCKTARVIQVFVPFSRNKYDNLDKHVPL